MPRRKQIQNKQIQAPNWDNHEVVIIRSKTGYDEEWIQDRSTIMTAGEMNMKILGGTTQKLTLIRCIESWTFSDANNQPLPWPPLSMREADNVAICQIREKSLEHVFPEDRTFIFNEIMALSQPMSDEEKKESSMTVLHGSQENHNGSHLKSLITS
jgi:hypothetical protein